jgi:hypothetical protein
LGRKPAKNPKQVQIAFRVDESTARALDEELAFEMNARPGLSLNRSDIARMLLAEALIARMKKRGRK